MLQLVSRHVIKNQEIGFKKFGTEFRRVVGLYQILAGDVTHNYYILGTTTKLNAVLSSGIVVTLEIWSNCN